MRIINPFYRLRAFNIASHRRSAGLLKSLLSGGRCNRKQAMNRILFELNEVDDAWRVVLRDRRAAHIAGVLRAKRGTKIRVGIIDGPCGGAVVERVSPAGEIALQCCFEEEAPAEPAVDLLLAVPRPKVLRRLWAPLASLGVANILLTNAAKVERNYFDTHWLAAATYRPLLIEGLQQSGDTRLPQVHVFRRFRPLVEDRLDELLPDRMRLLFHPREAAPVSDLRVEANRRVLLAIGPEGGWTNYEIDLLVSHGFQCVSIGWRVLRSDTACVALIAAVNARRTEIEV